MLVQRLTAMQREIENGSSMSNFKVQLEEMLQLTAQLDASFIEERK